MAIFGFLAFPRHMLQPSPSCVATDRRHPRPAPASPPTKLTRTHTLAPALARSSQRSKEQEKLRLMSPAQKSIQAKTDQTRAEWPLPPPPTPSRPPSLPKFPTADYFSARVAHTHTSTGLHAHATHTQKHYVNRPHAAAASEDFQRANTLERFSRLPRCDHT